MMNDEEFLTYAVILVTSEVASVSRALEHIRAGRSDTAIDSLEKALDRCVLCLGTMQRRTHDRDKNNVKNALQIIRAYRRRHPNPAADTDAQRILDEFEKDE